LLAEDDARTKARATDLHRSISMVFAVSSIANPRAGVPVRLIVRRMSP